MMKLINEKHEVYILQQNKLNTNKLSKYKDDSSFLLENEIEIILAKYPSYTQQVMMNPASSHDSPRLLTAFL